MPQQMPPNEVAQGFVIISLAVGSAAPVQQPTIPNGPDGKAQTLQLVSADPNTCTVALDSPALPPVDANGSPLLNPDGTPVVSCASFKVTSLAAPAQPNVPILITLNVLNSDGSTAATGTDTETVTENVTEVVGDLILAPTPIPAPASAKRR